MKRTTDTVQDARNDTRRDEIWLNGIWAVLPIKDFEQAKQRLAGVLSLVHRQNLFRCMVEDVLTALSQSQRLAGIVIVTRHPDAKALAAKYAAKVVEEPQNNGHTEAVMRGAHALAAKDVAGMIALPGDVPLVTAAEVDEVLAQHGAAPCITISPAHDELGSNAMVCSPPNVMKLRFGDNSYYPHINSARALNIEPNIVHCAGLALDVDHPQDLAVFCRSPSNTKAYRYLADNNLLNIAEASARSPAGFGTTVPGSRS